MKKIKMLLASCLAVAILFALTACQPTVLVSRYLDSDIATLGYSLKTDGVFTMYNRGEFPEDWSDYVFDTKNQVVIDRQWEDSIYEIKKVVINKNVSSVGTYAFYDARELTELVIGPDVTHIGENAFKNCNKLSKITIDKNNTSFAIKNNCLIEIDTGRLIRAIDTSDIKLDSEVNDIEEGAFYGLTSLKTVDLSESSITDIPVDAFKECSSLHSVKLPATVKSISDNAFFRCTKLDNINLADCSVLEKISTNAFFGCSSLKSVNLPESVTSIGVLAFSKCDSLDTVIVNNKNKFSVGVNAFYESNNIKKVYFNGLTGLDKLTRASYLGYLTATTYMCSNGKVTRDISIFIATDVYDAENLGTYLTNGDFYTKLDETEQFNGVEYIVYRANR